MRGSRGRSGFPGPADVARSRRRPAPTASRPPPCLRSGTAGAARWLVCAGLRGLPECGMPPSGKDLEGVAEAQAVEAFDELDGVAGFAAGGRHAAPQALAGRHDEVGGFLVVVEGTEAGPVRALGFEGDAARLDQGDEVGFGFDAVDFGVGDAGHGSVRSTIGGLWVGGVWKASR